MNIGVLSLIIFLIIVAISYYTKINAGLLSIAGAIIIGRLSGLTDMEIYSGVNLNVYTSMLGMFIYSAALLSSGALQLFVRKFLSRFHVGPKVWPLVCFLFTSAFANCGPSSMGCTVIPIITMSIGMSIGCDPLPVGIITALAGISAFASPISDGGSALFGIGMGGGLSGNIRFMAWVGTFIAAIVAAIVVYIVFRCWTWKTPEGAESYQAEELPKFTQKQLITILSLPVFIVTFILTGWHVGMLVCIFTVILIAIGAVDQKDVLAKTQWGAILLVVGTGIYMGVCKSLGGVDVLAQAIESVSNPLTVSSVYSFTGGFLSFFSYALAVPIPSLTPTIVPVLESMDLGAGAQLATYSALIAGSFIATISPMSFAGACVIGHWSTLTNADESVRSKTFTKQLIISVICLAVVSIFFMTGILTALAG
ncbi:MAG: hypothetical protein IKE21_01115 [Erysipelotrichaceae bacterium]|nr:hypothetical protein [Erysipelotrichaceae bacterium]